jgi:hypothetical protein
MGNACEKRFLEAAPEIDVCVDEPAGHCRE